MTLGSGTIRRCGLVVVGVALLEEVGHWGRPLSFPRLQPVLVAHCLFLLSANPGVELSAPFSASHLPESHHASCHDDNRLNFYKVSQPQ